MPQLDYTLIPWRVISVGLYVPLGPEGLSLENEPWQEKLKDIANIFFTLGFYVLKVESKGMSWKGTAERKAHSHTLCTE